MKALGIIRKIDDLGRVVVPKEVRESQGWGSGQPMEMFMDGEKLVLQAYGKEQEKQEALDRLETLLETEDNSGGKKLIKEVIAYVKGE